MSPCRCHRPLPRRATRFAVARFLSVLLAFHPGTFFLAAQPRCVHRLEIPDLYPEGIAVDPGTGRTFLSSLLHGGVLVVAQNGRARWFIPPGPEGPWRTLGLQVDHRRGLLWMASNGGTEQEPGDSAVFAADLRSGRILRRIPAPREGAHLLNDLALMADGTVYVTDSRAGTIHRIAQGSSRMEPLLPAGTLRYPNGIVAAKDQKALLVAAGGAGLYRIQRQGGAVRPVAIPPSLEPEALQGIDGLARRGDRLVAVQNGREPPRIVAFRLDPSETELEELDVLLSNHPVLAGIPTTGAWTGRNFRFIANSQILGLKTEPRKPSEPFLVMEIQATP